MNGTRTSWLIMLAAMVVSSGACTREATQLVVVVESDIPPSMLGEVDVRVRPLDPRADEPTVDQQFVLAATPTEGRISIPFSFGIVPPRGRDSSRIELVVEGRTRDSARTFVRRTVRTSFLAEQRLRLVVFLSASCIDSTCEESDGLTCVEGTCTSTEIDPGSLSTVRPGEELLDASGPDASRLDGGVPVDDVGRSDAGTIDPLPDPVSALVVPSTGTSSFDFAWDVATDDSGAGYLGLTTIAPEGSLAWSVAWTGLPSVRVVRRIRDALYLCVEIERSISTADGVSLTFPSAHGSGSAIVLARLDPDDGSTTWAKVISRGAPTSGPELRMDCGGIAETSDGLALAFGANLSSAPISFDGMPVTATVGATSNADGFVLRVRDDGTAATPTSLRAISTVGRLYTEFTPFDPRYQITITEDGAGGTIVTAFGQGPLVGLGNGESLSGTTPSIGVARYDAAGTPTWIDRFTLPGMLGTHTPRVATIGAAVYLATEVNVPDAGSTTLTGVPGLAPADARFDVNSLFVLPLALADGAPDVTRFRRSAHAGALTEMLAEPSGELVMVGYGRGDSDAAMSTPLDTFGEAWSVPDQDSGFVAAIDGTTLDARWLQPIAGETVMEDRFVSTTEWERVTGMDVSASGATWITGKLRTSVATNAVLGSTVGVVGYSARLR